MAPEGAEGQLLRSLAGTSCVPRWAAEGGELVCVTCLRDAGRDHKEDDDAQKALISEAGEGILHRDDLHGEAQAVHREDGCGIGDVGIRQAAAPHICRASGSATLPELATCG